MILFADFYCLKTNMGDNYARTQLQKDSILKLAQGEKIIFIGGSNIAFGIDSKRIEDHFNRSAVNMGVHAGFGLKFMLDNISGSIFRGDMVVIMPEYDHFVANNYYGEKPLFELIRSSPEKLKFINHYNQYLEFVKLVSFQNTRTIVFFYFFGDQLRVLPPKGSFLNCYGDIIAYLGEPSKGSKIPVLGLSGRINNDGFIGIIKFIKFVENRGANCVILMPPYQKRSAVHNFKTISIIQQKLAKSYSFVGNICVYDDSLFYDTGYHLNSEGRELNTDRIIKDLSGYWKLILRNDLSFCN